MTGHSPCKYFCFDITGVADWKAEVTACFLDPRLRFAGCASLMANLVPITWLLTILQCKAGVGNYLGFRCIGILHWGLDLDEGDGQGVGN